MKKVVLHGVCYLCGKQLLMGGKPKKVVCSICGSIHETQILCPDNHFVCQRCHDLEDLEIVENFCSCTVMEDPIKMANALFKNPRISINGREHYYIVVAVLLSAYYNKKKEFEKKKEKLKEARERLEKLHTDGYDAQYICDTSLMAGLFLHLIIGDTNYAAQEWKMCNQIVAKCLDVIAQTSERVCWTRNNFIIILESIHYLREYFSIFVTHGGVECEYTAKNPSCIKTKCPFYMQMRGSDTLL